MPFRSIPALLLLSALAGCPKNEIIPDETSSSETTDDPTGTTSPDVCGDNKCDAGEAESCPGDCVGCGNGVVDANEACDDGENNSDDYSATKHCNADCDGFAPRCGDDMCLPAEETPANCPLDCANPACGNGITEAGEQCDAGVDGTPTDSAECDDDCTTPSCGDGNENLAAEEECDDGNDDNSDACLKTCKLAVCGDGVVQEGGEACDDGNDVETDDCDKDCNVIEHRRVFVTSTNVEGKLGGLAGADEICQDLGGAMNYKAWLSDATTGPASDGRFDKTFTGIYELTNGELVAHGWADLIDGTLEHAIDQTEAGMTVVASGVWSNTTTAGAAIGGSHCKDWSSVDFADRGALGVSNAVMTPWTDTGELQPCSAGSRLYCFEDL